MSECVFLLLTGVFVLCSLIRIMTENSRMKSLNVALNRTKYWVCFHHEYNKTHWALSSVPLCPLPNYSTIRHNFWMCISMWLFFCKEPLFVITFEWRKRLEKKILTVFKKSSCSCYHAGRLDCLGDYRRLVGLRRIWSRPRLRSRSSFPNSRSFIS